MGVLATRTGIRGCLPEAALNRRSLLSFTLPALDVEAFFC